MCRVSKYLVVMGISLITISFSLLLRNRLNEEETIRKTNEVLNVIENTEIDEDLVVSDESEMRVVTIDGNDYIGTLEMPSLGLKLPIMSETSYEKLSVSPGRYYGSIYTNDLVICAHDYYDHFGKIDRLRTNDIIIFEDMNNRKYVYEVKMIEVLNSTDVLEMIESEFDLTLYTCTYDGLKRVTVRCNLVSDYT